MSALGLPFFDSGMSSYVYSTNGTLLPHASTDGTQNRRETFVDDISKWTCIPGVDVPVRRNAVGDIECMSSDGRNCSWGGCATKSATPVQPLQPLACGATHNSLYGGTGYDNPNHWCSMANKAIKLPFWGGV
jgi:hypothetical protein